MIVNSNPLLTSPYKGEENFMKASFQLGEFSGPLDLLLNLIAEEKMNVSEVSLSAVTEQFLNYLEKMENKKPEELADFLLIAARLLLLKSKKLLPQFSPEEEEGPSLEEQLRLYKMFMEAAKKFNKLWENEKRSIFRLEPPRRPREFAPPANLTLAGLRESMIKLLRRLEPLAPLPQSQIDKTVSLEEKIKNIQVLLKKTEDVSFSEIVNGSRNRTEVIIGFLALLELVKQKVVILKQKDNFKDILVMAHSEPHRRGAKDFLED